MGRFLFLAVVLVLAPLGLRAQEYGPPLAAGQSAIVFLVGGEALSGEIQVREADRQTIAWSTLIQPNAVRCFTVRPGRYAVLADKARQPVPIETRAGRATIVTLAGSARDGASFAVVKQSEVLPAEFETSDLGAFVLDHRVPAQALQPVSLEHLGAGLTFLLRPYY